jgi:NAD(P)-dependent dehydrogenase (short-subunit alcohol dehydrogenase family)
MSLSDRAVIITGGAGGIGLRVSERWLAAGASVLVVASRQDSVDLALSKLGKSSQLCGLAADLATEAGAAQMSAAAEAAFGRPADTLLHLVGGFAMGPIDAPDAPDV